MFSSAFVCLLAGMISQKTTPIVTKRKRECDPITTKIQVSYVCMDFCESRLSSVCTMLLTIKHDHLGGSMKTDRDRQTISM